MFFPLRNYIHHDIRHTPCMANGGSGRGVGCRASECVIPAVCHLEAMTTNERSSRTRGPHKHDLGLFYFSRFPFQFFFPCSYLFGFISRICVCRIGYRILFFLLSSFFLVISVTFYPRFPAIRIQIQIRMYISPIPSRSHFDFDFHPSPISIDFIPTNPISSAADAA